MMKQQYDLGHAYWMRMAYFFAKYAKACGEIPVGAVVVNQGRFVSAGWNQSITTHDPTAHAEIVALRKAAQILENYRLIDADLYVTLEPCAMCAGAIIHSRVRRVIFGATDLKTGAAGSFISLLNHESVNHKPDIIAGIGAEEASTLLSQFFRERRQQKKEQKQKLKAKTLCSVECSLL